MAIRIAQDYEYQGGSYWKWWLWIDGPDEELDQIESVEYTLHPTFPNPVRVITDRESKFRLDTAGWGVFRIYAIARLRSGEQTELEHELMLAKDDRQEEEAPVPEETGEDLPLGPDDEAPQADAFFEGPTFGGIAFAGALEGAAAAGGLTRWGRVGGADGGALVAAMLAVGFDWTEIRETIESADYRRLVRARGMMLPSAFRAVYGRGLFRSDALGAWIDEVLTAKVGHSPTFADVLDPENPGDLGPMRYRLRLLATDLTAIRLIVLPDDLPEYEDAKGRPLDPDRFPLADAVRMSMSSAILFEPFQLHHSGHAHFVVDGGVLSPFPVWLFDRPQAKRPTFGFLIAAAADSGEPYRPIPRLFGVFRLLVAMFRGIVRTRDREKMTRSDSIRTVAISAPPRAITFRLSPSDSSLLHENGRAAAREFFSVQREYVNSYGLSSETVIVPSTSPTEVASA